MRRTVQTNLDGQLNERLATRGFRFTPQREHVYAVLLRKRDHPTAEEVFIRRRMIAFPQQHSIDVLALRRKTKTARRQPLIQLALEVRFTVMGMIPQVARVPSLSIFGIILNSRSRPWHGARPDPHSPPPGPAKLSFPSAKDQTVFVPPHTPRLGAKTER